MKTTEYILPVHCCMVQVCLWELTPSHLPAPLQFLLLCCTPEPHETEHSVQFNQDNHSENSLGFIVQGQIKKNPYTIKL